ncbi:MAG: hypothetical protein HQM03_08120 [Magnetococcales bacterium]|nr:hypothetical protein [Magnetococcales bacterium]
MLPATGFGRSDTCAACSSDTRVCLNCRFHDPGSYNECRESVAERIVEKERANFCDFFKSKGAMPRNEVGGSYNRQQNSGKGRNSNQANNGVVNASAASAARAAAEALFKR